MPQTSTLDDHLISLESSDVVGATQSYRELPTFLADPAYKNRHKEIERAMKDAAIKYGDKDCDRWPVENPESNDD